MIPVNISTIFVLMIKGNAHINYGGGGLVAKSCPTLATPMDCQARLLCLWDSSDKNRG